MLKKNIRSVQIDIIDFLVRVSYYSQKKGYWFRDIPKKTGKNCAMILFITQNTKDVPLEHKINLYSD